MYHRFADVKAKIASKFLLHFRLLRIAKGGRIEYCFYVCVCFYLCLGKYHDLERQLIQEFTAAQRRGEIGRMREVAAVLLHFKVT